MIITRKLYDALMDWPFCQLAGSRDIVRRELPDIARQLDGAKNMGIWYRITTDICAKTNKDIIAASAKDAEQKLNRMVSHA